MRRITIAAVLPLTGKRILVTRTRSQASELAGRLEALGATPLLIPTIEIVPPESYAPLDHALAHLATFDWLLFTSANAVEVFRQRRDVLASSLPVVSANDQAPVPRIAVIGPATARAVDSLGLPVELIPPRYVAEALAEVLTPHAAGSRMLLIRAAEARNVLPQELTAAGAEVTIAEAYRNQTPPGSVAALQTLFAASANRPHAITFTSASTARNLFDLLDGAGIPLPGDVALASIGPITSETLRELGHPPVVEARQPTIPELVDAVLTYFSGLGTGCRE